MKFILVIILATTFSQNLLADEVLNFEAIYKIPTEDSKEKAYSTFTLDEYQVTLIDVDQKVRAELSYLLPVTMVGYSKKISMNLVINNGSEKVLAGNEATALCRGAWGQLKCEMRFHKLFIDLPAVAEALRLEGKGPNEINSRLKVLSRFSGDPIGFSEVIK